jgi:hypothetical protein
MKLWLLIKVCQEKNKLKFKKFFFFFVKLALSKASRSVAETLKSFKFFVVGSKQTDEERDIGLFFCQRNLLIFLFN